MKRVHIVGLAAIAAAGAVMLAACGGGYGSATPAVQNPPAAAQNAPAAPTKAATDASVKLTAIQNNTLGTIVTDGKGMTLYRFDKDTAKPAKSNCDGVCAAQWPPALVTGSQVALSGVDAGEVGTVTRSDGTKQLTIGNWPVYEFAGDSQPGDTNGQGVGGIWHAVTPQGKKATATVASGGTNSGY
jgi:predicted lipoprotein with Yx(FWY)xxD motif